MSGYWLLIHSGDSFDVKLNSLPSGCTNNGTLVLIKLPSATHGWQNGQHFFNLPFRMKAPGVILFTAPDSKDANLPPAFYMMFYVDCHGKPSMARMVRFDNTATEP